jgi:hypothetical protein
MKNYTDSDYALNKYSDGIVYRFADGSRFTVTLENYLAENPDKTGADFAALKEISDADYLERDRTEYNLTRKNVSIHALEDGDHFGGATLEEEFLDAFDREAAAKAYESVLASGALTETQARRFRLHALEGLTFRETAKREGVAVRAVQKSADAARRLLIEEFKKST